MSDQPVAQLPAGTVEAWAVYCFPELEQMTDEKFTSFLAAVVGYGDPELFWAFSDQRNLYGRCEFCVFNKIAEDCPGVQAHAKAQYDKHSVRHDFKFLQVDKFNVPANLSLGALYVEIERQINARATEETVKYRELYKK